MFYKFLNIETGKTFIATSGTKRLYEGNKLIKPLGSCDENGTIITAEGVVLQEKKADPKTIESLKKEMLSQNRVNEGDKGRKIEEETQDSYETDDEA